ncbi:MAG: hypothetical protein LBV56_07050 [Delftia acidovorans]|nr:hypothetical protein [Delftia acidovorans]
MPHLPILILSGALVLALGLAFLATFAALRAAAAARRAVELSEAAAQESVQEAASAARLLDMFDRCGAEAVTKMRLAASEEAVRRAKFQQEPRPLRHP